MGMVHVLREGRWWLLVSGRASGAHGTVAGGSDWDTGRSLSACPVPWLSVAERSSRSGAPGVPVEAGVSPLVAGYGWWVQVRPDGYGGMVITWQHRLAVMRLVADRFPHPVGRPIEMFRRGKRGGRRLCPANPLGCAWLPMKLSVRASRR